MNNTIRTHSIGMTVGSQHLAVRFNQILHEQEAGASAPATLGAMQVIAAQAIRELGAAEKKSRDPADVLALEDAERLASALEETAKPEEGGW